MGSELAAALAVRAKTERLKIVQVFPEEGNISLVLPSFLIKWTSSKLKDMGVEIKPRVTISRAAVKDSKINLTLSNDEDLVVDHVVVAAGISPNVELAKKSDLEIDPVHGGILVNAELEARTNVFAAGDVSSFHDIALGRRRVEHYDHAVASGRQAGLNMIGEKVSFFH